MASTTTALALPFGELTDSPTDLLSVPDLAQAVEDTWTAKFDGTANIGNPSTATVSLNGSAWTTLCSVTFTLPRVTSVELVGYARLVSTAAGRPMVALQVLDGSTHLFGTGQTHMGGTAAGETDELAIQTPRRRVQLASGAHTINLQAYKDGNGVVDAKRSDTYASQLISTTGLEAWV